MKIVFGLLLSVVLFSCGTNTTETVGAPIKPTREQLLHVVDSLEAKLRSAQQVDYQLGSAMVVAYINFVNHNQKDPEVVEMLFKAADVSMNLKQSKKAIELFAKVHDEYPPSERTAMALFLQAFIYETQVKDLAKAHELYNQVAAENPGTKLASDAEASIKLLGKSDEELIKEFEKKNKKK